MLDAPSVISRLRLDIEHSLQLINQLHYINLVWPETAYLASQMGDRLRCIIGDMSGIIQELESDSKMPQICGFEAIGISKTARAKTHEKEASKNESSYLPMLRIKI